jgi:hypothetical protein
MENESKILASGGIFKKPRTAEGGSRPRVAILNKKIEKLND